MLNLPAIKRPCCEVMSPYINYPKAGKETMLLKKQQGLQISIVLQIASNSDFFSFYMHMHFTELRVNSICDNKEK